MASAARILIVDDVEDTRLLYARYFAYAGLEVDEARDGEEALAKVAKDPPDLIVMDLSMPQLDGWEATRLVKTNPRTRGIVVVVVTAHAMASDLSRARAAGADEVVTKPCVPEDLLRRVRGLLEARCPT